MDNFNDVLTLFLCLECGRSVHGASESSCSDFIKLILIGVLKVNEGLTGLERHESE